MSKRTEGMMAKIVLRQTTKMTLSDRFGSLRNTSNSYAGSSRGLPVQTLPQTASIRSRKLAQQMERRPSVIAALKLKRKSLQNRLGNDGGNIRSLDRTSNVKSRLTLSSPSQRGSLRRATRGNSKRGRNNQRSPLRSVQQGGGIKKGKGISPLLKGRLGTGGNAPNRRGGRRGGGQRSKLNRATFSQNAQNKKKDRSRNQGNRPQWGRGRGRGSSKATAVSKQDLDNDLDAYMAKTKPHVDHDLDESMSVD